MKITDYIKTDLLYLDGGMGTLLQAEGLSPGESPERWNLSHPDVIRGIHAAYFAAGCHVVNANTFGANCLHFSKVELEDVIEAAIGHARAAATETPGAGPRWVALDIGPTGRMLKPYGDLDFEDAVEIFAQTVRLGVQYGADLIFIETMNDSYETKAALLAAKEHSDLPVFVSNAYGEDGKLMTGATPEAMVAMLEGMGADAVGINCSRGPRELRGVVERYLAAASVPVFCKPNAGLPRVAEGKTVYDVAPEEFADEIAACVRAGVHGVGGCCGTTPEYLHTVVQKTKDLQVTPLTDKNETVISSYTHALTFGKVPRLIGERINPTGKKRFKEALRDGDIGYILSEGIAQAEAGVDALDVNVGLPEIDERDMLVRTVTELQAVVDLPLQIDTSDPVAMEAALRRYNGKALINSVNGKRESMEAVFPLVRKYGGVVVALTLDENGIPEGAAGRLSIARRIKETAASYGIAPKNLIFDPLALTVSAEPMAARQTLEAIRCIREELGCLTSLGVSNVSFGLPARDYINGTFFSMALASGLSAAILNPFSLDMQKAYHAYCVLSGLDENCTKYIEFASTLPQNAGTVAQKTDVPNIETGVSVLEKAILKGLKQQAADACRARLSERAPLEIIAEEIIPALNTVGVGFEEKRIYLPGLLMSAEAAKCAFEVIKEQMPSGESTGGCRVILATVKGDIHDIGKNIVRLMLENYGFSVTDLGRDVAPEMIADAAVATHAPVAGLSALMTTTVPAMEETIKLLRVRAPWCRIVVGGAVLTRAYAEAIGADAYAKDAMETVRFAQQISEKEQM